MRKCGLEVFYVPSQINVADALTKALPRERFEQLVNVLGMQGPSSPVREQEGHEDIDYLDRAGDSRVPGP